MLEHQYIIKGLKMEKELKELEFKKAVIELYMAHVNETGTTPDFQEFGKFIGDEIFKTFKAPVMGEASAIKACQNFTEFLKGFNDFISKLEPNSFKAKKKNTEDMVMK